MTKKLMLMIGGAVLAFGAVAEEVRPDWADLVQKATSQEIYVPNDTTWVIQGDEDLDIIDGGAKRIRFGGNGKVVLDGTTRYFAKLHSDSTTCEIIKRGTTTTTHEGSGRSFTSYKGTLTIAEGTFVQAVYYPVSGDSGAHIRVKDGATLQINGDCGLGDATVHLEGTGFNDGGALIVDKCANYATSGIVLEDDAYAVLNDTAHNPISGADQPNSAASANQYRSPGFLNLNGHTLTIGGAATTTTFNSEIFQGDGEIAFEALGDGVRKVVFSGKVGLPDLSGLAKLTFASPAQIDMGVEQPLVADIVATDSLKITATVPSVVLNGVISGAADLAIDTSASAAVLSVRLGAVNTYTGSTSITGAGALNVLLSYGTSIPDFAKVAISGAKLVPALGNDPEGDLRWTADQALAFAATYQVTESQRKISFGTDELTGATRQVFDPVTIAKYFPALDVVWDAFGFGSGSYTLTGPYTDEKPLNLNVLSGTVRLSGDETIALGDVTVSGAVAGESGTLVLDGAKNVVYGDQTITVSSAAASTLVPPGRFVITNSTLCSTYHPADFSDPPTGALFIGRDANGVLEVEAGALVSNKLVVGGGGTYSSGNGVGAVYQRGGVVRPFCGSTAHLTSNIGAAGHGSYLLSDGLFRADGTFNIGGYNFGCFLQTGGTVEFGGMLYFPSHAGSGAYTILNGTTKMTDKGGYPNLVANTSGYAWVTVQGPNSLLTIKDSQYQLAYCGSVEGSDTHAIYNLNDDGVFELKSLRVYRTTYASTYPLILNFNGGMMRMCGSASPFCADTNFHLPKVVVYEKGIQIDTAGFDASNNGGRIEAEKAGGIQSIALPEPLPGCPAIPQVFIDGDGDGASAIALVDPATYTVTNILLTSHGWGYTAANTTVSLRYVCTGRGWIRTLYTFPASAVTIDDNEVGGFTKRGENTFTLKYANEWEKWTRVLGGTLKMSEAGAIPSGTALTLSNGATIDFNNLAEPTFTAIDGTGGTAANGSVKVVGEEGVLSVSAQKFIDRESTTIAGTLDLSAVTEIALTDADVLTEEAKSLRGLTLFSATTVVLPDEDISITGVPRGWHANLTARGLRLAADKGMMLLLR